MMDEPEIIINGVHLTNAQAMAVRVAISSFDVDCGDDEHGLAMSKAYAARLNEVFRIMIGLPAAKSLSMQTGNKS
jgi:hypothetical protein